MGEPSLDSVSRESSESCVEYKAIVVFEAIAAGLARCHFTKLLANFAKEVGRFDKLKSLSPGKFFVSTGNKELWDKLFATKQVSGYDISTRVPGLAMQLRGVLYGVPMELSEEEIVEMSKRRGMVRAKRLWTRKAGEKVPSQSVKVEFQSVRPSSVKLGGLWFDVHVFIPGPMRCYNCQRLGHFRDQCRGKKRCSRCGGEHDVSECAPGVQKYCCNCYGEHSAAYGGCPVMRQGKEVQRYRVCHQVSYAEAVKCVVFGGEADSAGPGPEASRPPPPALCVEAATSTSGDVMFV